MKKMLFTLVLLLLLPVVVEAKDKVKLSKCIDGDTARFILNGEEIKVRFLGINAPEIAGTNKEAEEFGDTAKDYTCNRLKKAEKIELEYDKASDKVDKYDRYLAYVFVDGKLLEVDILKKGYAKVQYINDKYKYYDDLVKAEEKAKENKKGIYGETEESEEKTIKSIFKFIKKNAKKLFTSIFDEIFD